MHKILDQRMALLDQLGVEHDNKENQLLQFFKKWLLNDYVQIVLLCLGQLQLLINYFGRLPKAFVSTRTNDNFLYVLYTVILASTLFFVLYVVPKVILKRRFLLATGIVVFYYFCVFTPIIYWYSIPLVNKVPPLIIQLGFKDYYVITVDTFERYGIFAHFMAHEFAYLISLEFIYTYSILFLYCLIKFGIFFQYKKQSIERLNVELESNYLKQQLNPHFLFNSLNNIYGLALKKDEKAIKIIEQLQQLLAFSSSQSKHNLVLLGEEVQSILNMIELEKIRHKSNFKIEHNLNWFIDSSLKIAPLILQTFVENAFKHGVNTDIDSPEVKINMNVVNNSLIFQVKNSLPKLVQLNQVGGVGLKNTLRRIELLYPEATCDITQNPHQYAVKLQLHLEK